MQRLSLLALTLAACGPPEPPADQTHRGNTARPRVDFVPGQLIVKLHAPLVTKRLEAASYSLTPIEPIAEDTWLMEVDAPPAELGGDTETEIVESADATLAARTQAAVAALASDPRVAFVHENWLLELSSAQPVHPSDPLYSAQAWHYGAIRLPDAWAITAGVSSVRIAIIDSGKTTPTAHTDLVWAEGRDFAGNHPSGDDDPTNNTDEYHHGIGVAGIAGARAGNGIGGVGVCSSCTLVPVRVTGALQSSADILKLTRAIYWVTGYNGQVDGGVRRAEVINISMNSPSAFCSSASSLQEAINRARDRGISVVASAGNDLAHRGPPTLPADCAGVIAVAASDRLGQLAAYSRRGAAVDVTAPGGSLHGTSLFGESVGPACASFGPGTHAGIQGVITAWTGWTLTPQANDHCHRSISGTSFAAPHVTGLIGLMRSVAPQLAPAELEAILASTARPSAVVDGVAGEFGAGLVDAHAAVLAALGGEVEVTPSVLPFPPTRVSTESTRPIAVRNTGGAALPVVIEASSALLGVTCPAGVACTCSAPSRCTITVPGLQQLTVNIRYAPTLTGSFSASLTVTPQRAGAAARTVAVTGAGTYAEARLTPESLDFGAVEVGRSAVHTMQLRNSGNAPFVASSFALTGDISQYSLLGVSAPRQVPPGAPFSFGVRCAPTSPGPKTVTLQVVSDANIPSLPVVIRCLGLAADARLTVGAGGTAFGVVPVGTSASRTIEVANVSGGNTTLTYELRQPAPPFVLSCLGGSCGCGPQKCQGQVHSTGNNALLSLTFRPTAPGASSAALVFISNDPQPPTTSLAFTGSGM